MRSRLPSPEELAEFVRSSFRSVWALELLFLLKRETRSWTRPELIAILRASDHVVTKSLDELSAAGFVSSEDEERVIFMPASQAMRDMIEQTEMLYTKQPDAVRRLIIASSSGSLAAFADAFRWKD